MLRRLLFVSMLALVPAAHAEEHEFDIRGLKIGMPLTALPKTLHCQRIGTSNIVECLPEAGTTIHVELTSPASGERVAKVTYSFYSRDRLGRDTHVGSVLIAKFGQPRETIEGWDWRQGSTVVKASVPGDMQQAFLSMEDPEFQKKVELAAEKPPAAKTTKPPKS